MFLYKIISDETMLYSTRIWKTICYGPQNRAYCLFHRDYDLPADNTKCNIRHWYKDNVWIDNNSN